MDISQGQIRSASISRVHSTGILIELAESKAICRRVDFAALFDLVLDNGTIRPDFTISPRLESK